MSKEIGPFQFKQFSIQHDRCAMKVGTDAVLLGAWASPTNAKSILDIGTGSGIIALMLAQRSPSDTIIDAVEVEQEDSAQATENVQLSPWPEKVRVYHTSIQDYKPTNQYDLIISNPPYFTDSLLPPSPRRETTRHTQRLSHRELLSTAKRLLSPSGKFTIILPTEEGNAFQEEGLSLDLHVNRRLRFYSRAHKPQERWLLEFSFTKPSVVDNETLILHQSGATWSPEYQALTRDFYLSV